MQRGFTPIPTGNANRIPVNLIKIAEDSGGSTDKSKRAHRRFDPVNHRRGTKRNSAWFNGQHPRARAAAFKQ